MTAPVAPLRFRGECDEPRGGACLRAAAGAAAAFGALPGSGSRARGPRRRRTLLSVPRRQDAVRPATARCSSPSHRASRDATPRRCSSTSSGARGCSSTRSRTGIGRTEVRWSTARTLGPGSQSLVWRPAADTPVGSYVMRLTVGENGRRRVYGRRRPVAPDRAARRSSRARRRGGVHQALVRPRGADVAPHPGGRGVVHAHVPPRRARAGPEPPQRRAHRASDGRPRRDRLERQALAAAGDHRAVGRLAVGALRREARDRRRAARLRALRPPALAPGASRVAAVLPTNTWQAYNLYDADGDGWGDTWYAGGLPPVVLDAPLSRARRPAALPAVRLPVPPLAGEDAPRAGHPRRRRPRGDPERGRAAAPLRPCRLPGAQRVHDRPRLRRRRAVPRPRGAARLPLREQLLLGCREAGERDATHDAVARSVPAGGAALRRPVPRQRRRPPTGAVRRQRPRRGAVALRGHRPRARQDARRRGRRVRDRDRHDDAGLAPRDARPRPDPQPLRARPPRGDELLRDHGRARGSFRRACWTSPPSCSTRPGSG